VAFVSNKKGAYNLYLKASNNTGAETLKLETPNSKYAQDWSKDGQFLLYVEDSPKTGRDLWALPMSGVNPMPIEVIKTPYEETNGQFSPDGHWVAYETNESGQSQIMVQSFPTPSGKWQVSQSGGTQVRWKPDGKELYFISLDGKLMAAPVSSSGGTFVPGTPTPLFSALLVPGGGANRQNYAVSRDGRFLLNQPIESASTTPITLLLNWSPERGK
jgi:Tol biopolymer transport system component